MNLSSGIPVSFYEEQFTFFHLENTEEKGKGKKNFF